MRLSSDLAFVLVAALTATTTTAAAVSNARQQVPWEKKVDPWVLSAAGAGSAEFLVMLSEQADLAPARQLATKALKGRFVFDRLRETAARTQGPLLAALAARGVEHRAYWVANMVWVRGDLALVAELAQRDDVAHVFANPSVKFQGPVEQGPTDFDAPHVVEWGVAKVRGPEVWAAGFNGGGIVVGGQDTGYDWDHPALKAKYRGWDGTTADHSDSWHDSIHSGGGVCGADSPEPCDDNGHGTHTMGTMVGDDGAGNQVGVAPGARWIGCRNMDQGNGTPTTYSECFQWFIAPGGPADTNADPGKAPDVINNSWGCPPSEGCTNPLILQTVVENTRAAGIVVVVSAGNGGSSCSTVSDPPPIYEASFSVGATGNTPTDTIASFSSRGPVTADGSNRLKPNVSAPGVGIRSSVPGGGYGGSSGTSMAGPHVVGVVALFLSAHPALRGDVDAIENALESTSIPRTSTQTCGGVPGTAIPNNTYGFGRVDAFDAAFANTADLGLSSPAWPATVVTGQPLTYTLTVANTGPAGATGVALTQALPASVTVNTTTPSQGSCAVTGPVAVDNSGTMVRTINCTLGAIALAGSATVQITVTPSALGPLVSRATVSAGGFDIVVTNNSVDFQTMVQASGPTSSARRTRSAVARER